MHSSSESRARSSASSAAGRGAASTSRSPTRPMPSAWPTRHRREPGTLARQTPSCAVQTDRSLPITPTSRASPGCSRGSVGDGSAGAHVRLLRGARPSCWAAVVPARPRKPSSHKRAHGSRSYRAGAQTATIRSPGVIQTPASSSTPHPSACTPTAPQVPSPRPTLPGSNRCAASWTSSTTPRERASASQQSASRSPSRAALRCLWHRRGSPLSCSRAVPSTTG